MFILREWVAEWANIDLLASVFGITIESVSECENVYSKRQYFYYIL